MSSKFVYRIDVKLKTSSKEFVKVFAIKSKGLWFSQFAIDLGVYLRGHKIIKVIDNKYTYDYVIPKKAIWLTYKNGVLCKENKEV